MRILNLLCAMLTAAHVLYGDIEKLEIVVF